MSIKDVNEKRLNSYVKTLEETEAVEFSYNEYYYDIFKTIAYGYMVNVYSDDKKDGFGDYLDKNSIDGGLCSGSARDAVEFML